LAAVGTATAQSSQPTVVVSDGTTAPDSTTTVDIVLTSAPNGLAGFYLELTAESVGAQIKSVGYPDRFGLTSEPDITANGTAVTLESADTDGVVEAGATNVTLATVTISGTATGDVTLSVEPRQLDDDNGSAIDPATQSGTITVVGSETEAVSPEQSSGETNGANAGGGAEMPATVTDSESGAVTGVQTTSESGPLPIVVSLIAIAIAVLSAVGLRRRT